MKHWLSAAVLAAAWAAPQEDLKPGLVGEYFDLGQAVEDFPDVSGRKPNLRRVDLYIAWASTSEKFADTEMSDHFYVRWTGLLRAPKDGKYTFFVESDDGSRLWVAGKHVIDHGGLHPMEEKSGEIELKAGDHEVRMDFFENEGEVGCKLSWEGPGISKEVVPASVLFHKKDPELDK